MSAKDRFTIIRCSGRADNCKEGADYWSVLSDVSTEMSCAGGSWDAPNMLMRNGKIVVEEGLDQLAWAYCHERGIAIAEAAAAVRDKHCPEWLKEMTK